MEELDCESDCGSSDSGLETGQSNTMESQGDNFNEASHNLNSESIYENAEILARSDSAQKSSEDDAYEEDLDLDEEDQQEEEAEHEEDDDDNCEVGAEAAKRPLTQYEFGGSIKARPRRNSEGRSHLKEIEQFASGGEEKRIWGVRNSSSVKTTYSSKANSNTKSVNRKVNPTEDMIAKEIKELKEREEELKRYRTVGDEAVGEEAARAEVERPKPLKQPASHHRVEAARNTAKKSTEKKFNPANFRPVVIPQRPRIMEEFLGNGGRVTAFVQPDNSVIQLRKPQVHKSRPKVTPPRPSGHQEGRSRQPCALDKIQMELIETRRREEELRNMRKNMFRSQPDLRQISPSSDDLENAEEVDDEEEDGGHDWDQESEDRGRPRDSDSEENENVSDEEGERPSLVHTRGKSSLISVWEQRIQTAN